MKGIKYILFDCMETIVDLRQLPDLRDYACWGYSGSGVEELWKDFDEYFRFYLLARTDIGSRLHENQEYEMYERFFHIINLSFPDMPVSRMEQTARRLNDNYWKNYKEKCYIREDVLYGLERLSKKYKLGVVSNFMVKDGIEELLEINGVRGYFSFVTTSITEGWRKPHPVIYRTALDKFGAKPEETVFIGDDYVNDYVAPKELGMNPVYLDRFGRHTEIQNRVLDFYQLVEIL
jgi:haloacid dehalogenase superfamily, subfamily IA, variant 1 with third motif having Dx(3-4)D or Dx(3-4)E